MNAGRNGRKRDGDIEKLLLKYGFRFNKSMGQNFLVDTSVPERIARESGASHGTGVLEIGPGIGALTSELAKRADKVVSIELDERLLPLLTETLSGYTNVDIIPGDIMKTNICKLVPEKFAGLRVLVCANLPYNITTPVLTMLMESRVFSSITVMIQREVAKRLCAEAGTPDYGAFTVFTKYYSEPKILFDVFPESFIPQPKVVSSVVRLNMRETPPVETNEQKLFRLVRASFSQRRKTLVNSVSSTLGIEKSVIAEIVSSIGYDTNIRGEMLDIVAFSRLADELGDKLK